MKKILSIFLVLLLVVSMTGCMNYKELLNKGNQKETVTENINESKEDIENIGGNNTKNTKKSTSHESLEKIMADGSMEKYVNDKRSVSRFYDYYDEENEIDLHFREAKQNSENTVLSFVLGFSNFEEDIDEEFYLKYVINDNNVTEVIQKDRDNEETVTLYSIIPNQIILQTPLKKGNSWSQKFSYNGKEYTAKTTLVSISENKDGDKMYKTETVVKDIEGFSDNTYTETRVFEAGKGLVFFQSNKPVEIGDKKIGEDSKYYLTLIMTDDSFYDEEYKY